MNPNYSYDNFQVEMNSLDEVNNDSNSSNSKNINKELENNNKMIIIRLTLIILIVEKH